MWLISVRSPAPPSLATLTPFHRGPPLTDRPLESLPYLPVLTRFAIVRAVFLFVPKLCSRIDLPSAVGLLIAGVLLGPSGLKVVPQNSQLAEFFAELEIDIEQFTQTHKQSMIFGGMTSACLC